MSPLETTKLFSSTHGTNEGNDQQVAQEDQDENINLFSEILNETGITGSTSASRPTTIMYNFILLSALFSANHGAVVSCLSLATARLGDLGSWQSSALYLSYTMSALFGATFVVKNMGPRNSIITGMWIYCVYVACFVIATIFPGIKEVSALMGALVGGIGGGFLWTAQGSYFARASEEYALAKSLSIEDSTSLLGGIFAGIYLGFEVLLRLFSSIMLNWNWSWVSIFTGYTIVAVGAALLMAFAVDYPASEEEKRRNDSQSTFYKSTVTFRLLLSDPKMKYMVPLSATFALSSVLIITFVNGEVVRVALSDSNSVYIGLLTSITAAVGGIMSVVFGFASRRIGNATILVIGCVSFFSISFLFLLYPNLTSWNLQSLILVYGLQGVGRGKFCFVRTIFVMCPCTPYPYAFTHVVLQFSLDLSL